MLQLNILHAYMYTNLISFFSTHKFRSSHSFIKEPREKERDGERKLCRISSLSGLQIYTHIGGECLALKIYLSLRIYMHIYMHIKEKLSRIYYYKYKDITNTCFGVEDSPLTHPLLNSMFRANFRRVSTPRLLIYSGIRMCARFMYL